MARVKSEIHFGLVNIPFTYQPVIKNNDVTFHQLHKKCLHRICYQKFCPHCKVILKENEILKGYEVSDEEYVTFAKEELNNLKYMVDGIEIVSFVMKKDIDAYYYEKSYVLLPIKKSHAYSLFGEVLKKSHKVALAKTTLNTKFYYCIIEWKDSYLLMTTLYFLEEVNLPEKIETSKFTKKEMELGELLVKQLSADFKPSKYQDDYQKQIKEAIKQKEKGLKVENKKSKKQPNVKNLVIALQKSLDSKK